LRTSWGIRVFQSSSARRLKRSRKLADPVSESFDRNVARIQEIASTNPVEIFDKLAGIMLASRSVCVMGVRTAHAPALVLGQGLLHVRSSVFVVPEPSVDWYDVLKFFGKDDLLLAVSFPRYWRETIDALRYAREKGVSAVAITDVAVSPAAQEADFALLTGTDSTGFSLSYTGCFALIDALLASVARTAGKENAEALAELETIYEKADLFYHTRSTPRKAPAHRDPNDRKGGGP
jgi:DNA-binding MurR/RpiR family transcriptional regulator